MGQFRAFRFRGNACGSRVVAAAVRGLGPRRYDSDPMTEEILDLKPATGDPDSLAAYAQRAYLEYALSVVKGRALPDVCDG